MKKWNEVFSENASTATLLRCGRQFQRALDLLYRHADEGLLEQNEEVAEIHRGLRLIRTELRQRGLNALLAKD